MHCCVRVTARPHAWPCVRVQQRQQGSRPARAGRRAGREGQGGCQVQQRWKLIIIVVGPGQNAGRG